MPGTNSSMHHLAVCWPINVIAQGFSNTSQNLKRGAVSAESSLLPWLLERLQFCDREIPPDNSACCSSHIAASACFQRFTCRRVSAVFVHLSLTSAAWPSILFPDVGAAPAFRNRVVSFLTDVACALVSPCSFSLRLCIAPSLSSQTAAVWNRIPSFLSVPPLDQLIGQCVQHSQDVVSTKTRLASSAWTKKKTYTPMQGWKLHRTVFSWTHNNWASRTSQSHPYVANSAMSLATAVGEVHHAVRPVPPPWPVHLADTAEPICE